jgi:hypothetical protein
LVAGWTKSPKIVQGSELALRVLPLPAEKPEIAILVGPTGGIFVRSGDIARREYTQRPPRFRHIQVTFESRVGAADPGPFVYAAGLRSGGQSGNSKREQKTKQTA